ncbi:hypothetical protein ABZ612_16395 [Streptomyces avermitilis]|uniref:hypothetical protein n=1 Tax=Streptomyces avermitilis TaxID=33903 RepID=UPI0033EC368C
MNFINTQQEMISGALYMTLVTLVVLVGPYSIGEATIATAPLTGLLVIRLVHHESPSSLAFLLICLAACVVVAAVILRARPPALDISAICVVILTLAIPVLIHEPSLSGSQVVASHLFVGGVIAP